MKKIITLLLAAGAFATVNAQTTKEEARRVILGGEKKGSGDNNTTRGRDVILGDDNGTSRYPGTSREAEVDQINREYDAKIVSIRNNPNLSAEEKERIIRNLQKERQRKIRQVNERYNGDRDDDDRDGKKYKKDKKQKSNNGKHLGWEKGKGNPHKNGGTPVKGKGKKS